MSVGECVCVCVCVGVVLVLSDGECECVRVCVTVVEGWLSSSKIKKSTIPRDSFVYRV